VPTVEQYIYITKEMLGYMGSQPINPPGVNQGDEGFGLYAPGVVDFSTHLENDADYYRLGGWQLGGRDEFSNGQWWGLEVYTGDGDPRSDTENWETVYSQMTPKNDLVSGLGLGDDYIVFETGGEHIVLDLAGPFSSTPEDITYEPDRDPDGTGAPTFEEAEDAFEDAYPETVPCLTAGTYIETETGSQLIETLKVGDLVLTKDNGFQPIRWIGRRSIGGRFLKENEHLRPIRIRSGALGNGHPTTDLLVSPQHRILVMSKIARRMFDTAEVLVAAKQLLEIDGVDIDNDSAEVVYIHLLFDQHEILTSNGAETESMFIGPEALKSIVPSARREIFSLFPELENMTTLPVPARTLVPGRKALTLTYRHVKNERPLYSQSQIA